jgi:hypothetical protein
LAIRRLFLQVRAILFAIEIEQPREQKEQRRQRKPIQRGEERSSAFSRKMATGV